MWKDGKRNDWLVARLVAITFLGVPPYGFTVNHKDGNRFNNSVENLEWLSVGDNIRHGFVTGLYSNQKEIRVSCNGYVFVFRSYASLDRHLGRHVGYTSDAIANGRQITDICGNIFRVTTKRSDT